VVGVKHYFLAGRARASNGGSAHCHADRPGQAAVRATDRANRRGVSGRDATKHEDPICRDVCHVQLAPDMPDLLRGIEAGAVGVADAPSTRSRFQPGASEAA